MYNKTIKYRFFLKERTKMGTNINNKTNNEVVIEEIKHFSQLYDKKYLIKGFIYVVLNKDNLEENVVSLYTSRKIKKNLFSKVSPDFQDNKIKRFIIYFQQKELSRFELNLIKKHLIINFNHSQIKVLNRNKKILTKPLIYNKKNCKKTDLEKIINEIYNYSLHSIGLPLPYKKTSFYDKESKRFIERIFKLNSVNVSNYKSSETYFKSNDISKSPPGIVAGIIGVWGSGKTTFTNEMMVHAGNSPIIKIDPWGVSGEKGNLNFFILKEIFATLEAYNNIKGINIRPVINFVTVIADFTLSNLKIKGNLFSELAKTFDRIKGKDKNYSTQKKYELAAASLIKLPCPIIITIDNLDRATPEEVFSFIKLLRTFLSLPNIIFIISYDETILYNGIVKNDLDGNRYLKKIVDIRYYLLAPGKTEIKDALYKNFTSESLRREIDFFLKEETSNSIRSFRNYRDSTLLIEDVKDIYNKTQINIRDLLYMEDLKHNNLNLWYLIYEYRDSLFEGALNPEENKSKKRKDIAISQITKNASDEEEIILRKILFPNAFLVKKPLGERVESKTFFQRERLSFDTSIGNVESLNDYYDASMNHNYFLMESAKEILINSKMINIHKYLKIEDEKSSIILGKILKNIQEDDLSGFNTYDQVAIIYNYIFDVFQNGIDKLEISSVFIADINSDICSLLSLLLDRTSYEDHTDSHTIDNLMLMQIAGSENSKNYLSKLMIIWLAFNPEYDGWKTPSHYKINDCTMEFIEKQILKLFPSSFEKEICQDLIWIFWRKFVNDYNFESKTTYINFNDFNKNKYLQIFEEYSFSTGFPENVYNEIKNSKYLNEIDKENILNYIDNIESHL